MPTRSSAAAFLADVVIYLIVTLAFSVMVAAAFALGMDLSQFRYATL